MLYHQNDWSDALREPHNSLTHKASKLYTSPANGSATQEIKADTLQHHVDSRVIALTSTSVRVYKSIEMMTPPT
jgi:hypothetical protein